MDPLEQQYRQLTELFPQANLRRRNDGTSLITIPNFPLSSGWSRETTEICFVIPLGYPVANPDTFWTDIDLRLAGGGFPANTQINATYASSGDNPQLKLWFSYHPSTWSPSHDTITTFVKLIQRRLQEPQ